MIYLLALLPVLAVGLIFLALGDMRPGILFSTSVPVGFAASPAGRHIVRNYRLAGTVAIAALMAFSALAARSGRIVTAPIAVFVEIAIWIALYYVGMRQTRPFAICPPLVRTASLAPEDSMKPVILGVLACFLPLAAAAMYLHLHWAQIPASFPTHWDIDGNVNGWSERTVAAVYRPIWIGASLIFMMLSIAISTLYVNGEERLRRLSRTIVLPTTMFLSLLFAWIALLPLVGSKMFAIYVGPLSLLFVVAIVFWSRRMQLHAGKSGEPYDGTPDQRWYGGMFYFNPKDRAILVPKRFGIGYSLNFARPASWLWLALVLLPLGFFLLHKHTR